MLYSLISAAQKRERFRARLATGDLLVMPGAFNPLSAKLIERKNFDGVYVSPAALAAGLGLPDIGVTTLSEVATRSAQIARVTDLPTLADADFGEPVNVARAVQVLADSGVGGLHIEDQVNPKRCGHLDGKQVVDERSAIRRVRAAMTARRDTNLLVMARTNIRSVEGLAAAVERFKALVDAGAEAIFPEAMMDLKEFEKIRAAIDVPMLANMTEFGKSELFTTRQLADVGDNIVTYSVSLLRLAMGSAVRALDTITREGSLTSMLDEMQHRADLYELLDYDSYNAYDSSIFNFDVPPKCPVSLKR